MKASWLKRLSVARTKKSEFLVGALVLAGLLAVLVIGAFQLEPLAALERQIDDVATAHFTPAADGPHPDVAVVAIDDATIAAHPPRSPINRNLLARLIEILEAGNPRAIGIDILLTHPTDEAADRRLAQALRASEVPVVVATALDEGQPQPLAQAFDDPRIEPAVANLPIDRSREIVREFRTDFEDFQGRLHATLSKRLAEIAGGTEITDAKTPRPIDWYGRPGLAAAGGDGREQPAIATFPAHVFLDVPSATALLKGKVVLIGATFEGAADRVKTPFTRLTADGRGLAGVQVHAQLVAQLMDGRQRPQAAPALRWVLVAGALLIAFLVTLKRPPLAITIALALTLPVAWIVVSLWLRSQGSVPVAALPPALAFGLGVGAFSAYQARRLDRLQRRALSALAKRVPPGVIEHMVSDPDLIRLGGESRTVSVLFTDIAGFTRFAEQRPAAEVMDFLAVYMEAVSDVVLRHGGTIDKFIGDSVMAFWGAPLDQPDHALSAVNCALELDRRCRDVAAPMGLTTRIGIHSGEATVGFLGSRERLEYTAIGDVVNVASRIEGANKYFGTSLCMSEQSKREIGDSLPEVALLRVGKVQLYGRETPINLYAPAPDDYTDACLQRYEQALISLEAGNFQEARESLAMLPKNELTRFQLSRCEDAVAGPINLEAK